MSDVVIAGIGQMPVGEHYTASLRDLALDAIETGAAGCRRICGRIFYTWPTCSPRSFPTRRTWAR